jgi:hypothetical protein
MSTTFTSISFARTFEDGFSFTLAWFLTCQLDSCKHKASCKAERWANAYIDYCRTPRPPFNPFNRLTTPPHAPVRNSFTKYDTSNIMSSPASSNPKIISKGNSMARRNANIQIQHSGESKLKDQVSFHPAALFNTDFSAGISRSPTFLQRVPLSWI